jgi:hypothetical protein
LLQCVDVNALHTRLKESKAVEHKCVEEQKLKFMVR